MNNYVSGATLISEIVKNRPECVRILRACGMHCVGCPASKEESLEQACRVHGLKTEWVVKALNEEIAEALQK